MSEIACENVYSAIQSVHPTGQLITQKRTPALASVRIEQIHSGGPKSRTRHR
jgi:hypothetical protein